MWKLQTKKAILRSEYYILNLCHFGSWWIFKKIWCNESVWMSCFFFHMIKKREKEKPKNSKTWCYFLCHLVTPLNNNEFCIQLDQFFTNNNFSFSFYHKVIMSIQSTYCSYQCITLFRFEYGSNKFIIIDAS